MLNNTFGNDAWSIICVVRSLLLLLVDFYFVPAFESEAVAELKYFNKKLDFWSQAVSM